MRRLVRSAVAAAALLSGFLLVAPAPASAEGKCVELYLYVTNPPTGATVCTPDI